MKQETQTVGIILFADQIRWINKNYMNLPQFVQDALDEMMYEDPDEEVRKEIDKRREEKLKNFLERKK